MLRKACRATVPAILLTTIILFFSAALAQVVTGCTGHQRHKTLRATLTSLVVAREGFEKWDEAQQREIVEKATSKEQGQEALSAFRTRRDLVYDAFEIAFRLIATASLDSEDQTLSQAIDQAKRVLIKIAELQGGS